MDHAANYCGGRKQVGERVVPPTLWAAMKAASRIEIDAPLDARRSISQMLMRTSARMSGLTASWKSCAVTVAVWLMAGLAFAGGRAQSTGPRIDG
jgi:hypothetical protein